MIFFPPTDLTKVNYSEGRGLPGQNGHGGAVDYAVPVGTAVTAIQEGKVIYAATHVAQGVGKRSYGKLVIVEHKIQCGDGSYHYFYSYYGHLSDIQVQVNDTVTPGQLIGLSGNTGTSSGPHLHFEIKHNADWSQMSPFGGGRDSLSDGISPPCEPPKKPPLDPIPSAPGLPRRDPLVLDLDGNGIQTLGMDAGVRFDHDANGFYERSGWVGGGDGFLVWDRNGNDLLDGGTGNDVLAGEAGSDTYLFRHLAGLGGNDVFDGGIGDDRLCSGRETFIKNPAVKRRRTPQMCPAF